MKKILTLTCLLIALGIQARVCIIPQPTQVQETGSRFHVTQGQTIGYTDKQLRPAALYLQEVLTRATGLQIPVRKGKGTYTLQFDGKADPQDESYRLSVNPWEVQLTAHCYRGITNGIATIRQLLPAEIESQTPVPGVKWQMPTVEIADQPAYGWRGLMLDPVRHFYTVEETKRLIDQMALYKYSKLHWHLIDDEGWRIEIKKYPQLTQQGGWRPKKTYIDSICFARAEREANPTLLPPASKYREINGQQMYGGYYTQNEIREVVRYAAQRGLDVIPELDMPGHNSVAQRVFPWLSCTGEVNRVYCLGQDRTIDFCKDVYKEVFKLFPYEYVHIGGDEVERHIWSECPKCQQRIKDERLDGVEQLQAWFTREMEHYFNAHHRKLMGWDEILDGGVSKTATIYWWRGDHPDVTQRSTSMGNEVVVCPTTFCYFDYIQDNNTLRHIYEGDIVPADLTPEQHRLIKGIQANLWGEFMASEARMQFMVFPRALALAEKAWTPRSEHIWDQFLPRLQQHLHRLDIMHVNYRPLETDIK